MWIQVYKYVIDPYIQIWNWSTYKYGIDPYIPKKNEFSINTSQAFFHWFYVYKYTYVHAPIVRIRCVNMRPGFCLSTWILLCMCVCVRVFPCVFMCVRACASAYACVCVCAMLSHWLFLSVSFAHALALARACMLSDSLSNVTDGL